MRRRPEPPTFAARLGMLLTWIVLLAFGCFAIQLTAVVLGFNDHYHPYEPADWATMEPGSISMIVDGLGGDPRESAATAALPFLTIAIFLVVFGWKVRSPRQRRGLLAGSTRRDR